MTTRCAKLFPTDFSTCCGKLGLTPSPLDVELHDGAPAFRFASAGRPRPKLLLLLTAALLPLGLVLAWVARAERPRSRSAPWSSAPTQQGLAAIAGASKA